MRLQLSSSTAPPRRIMRCHGKRSSSSAQDQEKRNTQKGEDSSLHHAPLTWFISWLATL